MWRALAGSAIAVGCITSLMTSAEAIVILRPATPGASQTMIGCLQKGQSATAFTLADVQGTGPKQVQIDGVAPGADLTKYIGQQVAITGTRVESTPGKPPAAAKGPSAEQRIRVLSVKMLSATCR